MTREDKELLFVDLCARLPYGVMFSVFGKDEELKELSRVIAFVNGGTLNDKYALQNCKPYLHPMSSMTEEEIKEFYKIENIMPKVGYICPSQDWHFTVKGFNWLLKNHFDFRGLIEKGLAIAITEENNPYKK